MDIHNNARTTSLIRAMRDNRVSEDHWPVDVMVVGFGIPERAVYKWLARLGTEGRTGPRDQEWCAHHLPHALASTWLALVCLLR